MLLMYFFQIHLNQEKIILKIDKLKSKGEVIYNRRKV